MAHFNLSKLSCDIIFDFITCLSRRRESDSRPLSYQESVLPLNYSGIILANFSFLIQSLNPNTNASMAFAPVCVYTTTLEPILSEMTEKGSRASEACGLAL